METVGWINKDEYIEPELCNEYVRYTTKWYCLLPTSCAYALNMNMKQQIMCLKSSLVFDPTCNLFNMTQCNLRRNKIDDEFTVYKQLGDTYDIVTKTKNYFITAENGKQYQYKVPLGGKFLVTLNKYEMLKIAV